MVVAGTPRLMDLKLRVVTQIPLQDLWRDDGFTTTSSSHWLGGADIATLLQGGPVQFVVADVGLCLRWIPVIDCFRFWRDQVKPHLAPPELAVRLSDFPGEYFYRARQWAASEVTPPIVCLELHH